MSLVKSLIFNRLVLSLLIGACFIVALMDMFLDNARFRIVTSTALMVAENNAQVVSSLSKVYEELYQNKNAKLSNSQLVSELNQKLKNNKQDLSINLINLLKPKDSFQKEAIQNLKLKPTIPFIKFDRIQTEPVLRYALINNEFNHATQNQNNIIELVLPLSQFEDISNEESLKVLWAMVIIALFSILSLSYTIGKIRLSSETLIETKQVALNEQKALTYAYERFFPHRFLDLLLKKNILEVNLGDQIEKKMAVLFADVRNFTTILEKKTPQESFQFINHYLSILGPIVREYNGFIDKYIGDAIMALFDDSVENAIDATIDIIRTLKKGENSLNEVVDIGVGIHYGTLMVGTIGEEERMDATVISDTVNTASRLEDLNKFYETHIIISKEILTNLKDKNKYQIRFLDHIYAKGKTKPISIFEIFDVDPPEIIEKKISIQSHFDLAITFYHTKCFKEALKFFKRCQNIFPNDKLTNIYVKRCEKFILEGVNLDWKPITKFTQKSEFE